MPIVWKTVDSRVWEIAVPVPWNSGECIIEIFDAQTHRRFARVSAGIFDGNACCSVSDMPCGRQVCVEAKHGGRTVKGTCRVPFLEPEQAVVNMTTERVEVPLTTIQAVMPGILVDDMKLRMGNRSLAVRPSSPMFALVSERTSQNMISCRLAEILDGAFVFDCEVGS